MLKLFSTIQICTKYVYPYTAINSLPFEHYTVQGSKRLQLLNSLLITLPIAITLDTLGFLLKAIAEGITH